MTRTIGATDLVPRKRRSVTRSDKGVRRKFYRKRPVKKKRKSYGKLVLYKPKRNPGDPLKFEFWDITRMDVESLHHFNKRVRNFMKRTVYGRNRLYFTIDPIDINTREKFEEFCEEYLWEGNWLIMMRGHAKNPWHNSPKAVGSVIIKNTSEGNRARLTPSHGSRGLFRYSWWWKG